MDISILNKYLYILYLHNGWLSFMKLIISYNNYNNISELINHHLNPYLSRIYHLSTIDT